MDTIPVGKSIGGAYGFLFRRFFTILGLSWLPAAIYGVGRLVFIQHVEPGLAAALHAGGHPSVMTHVLLGAFVLFSLLLVAVIALPLTREALGMGDEPVLARLVVGARELRLFAAYIRIDIILIVLVMALVFGMIGAAWGTRYALAHWAQGMPLTGWPVLSIVHGVLAIIAVLILLCVALRLAFLITPVAVAEDKARLARAWSLSSGNFWRIFAIFLVIVVPVIAVLGVCEYLVIGGQMHAAARAMLAAGHHDPSALVSVAMAHGPVLVTIAAVGLVIVNALFAGASATAYRALVPPPEPENVVYEETAETHAHIEPYAEPAHEPEPEMPTEESAPVAQETVIAEEEHAAEEAPAEEAPQEAPAEPEPSHEAAAEAPAEEAAEQPMELQEPAAQEAPQNAEQVPPPPEVPEDPGAHVH